MGWVYVRCPFKHLDTLQPEGSGINMGAPRLVLWGERSTHVCDLMCLHMPMPTFLVIWCASLVILVKLMTVSVSVILVKLVSVRRARYHMIVLHIATQPLPFFLAWLRSYSLSY